MDSTNLGERILARRTALPDDESDAVDDCGAYACLRGARDRAVMIDFRFLNGNREAFPYATLERVTYDPSIGITLQFMGTRVLVEGRNLVTPAMTGCGLLEGIHRQRVPWVREIEELRGKFQATDTAVVMKIEIRIEK